MKKIFLLISLVTTIVVVRAEGGRYGNLKWELKDSVLTINGEGNMPVKNQSSIPWQKDKIRSRIKKVNISEGVTGIGEEAFYDCSSLTSVTIPNSVTYIGKAAFSHCGKLIHINIPSGIKSIEGYTFQYCNSLVNIHIPNQITSIGKRGFYGCSSLSTINIPSSIKKIDEEAFHGCANLSAVHISDLKDWCNILFGIGGSNPLIYAHNLYLNNKKITNLEIPESVSTIRFASFLGCSMHSVTIPNSVTNIEDYAFQHCSNLTSVTIPNSVTNIGMFAFANCKSLSSIIIPDGITRITRGMFAVCTGLTSVSIPNSVATIESYAFSGCKNLQTIILTSSLEAIEEDAFAFCDRLSSIMIPLGVKRIDTNAFRGCTALNEFLYPIGSDFSKVKVNPFTKRRAYDPTSFFLTSTTASSRSTSATNNATTSRTAVSSTTSQSTTHAQSSYTKPTTSTVRPICTILSPKEGDPYSTPTIRLEYKIENISEVESVKFFVNGIERKPKNNGSNKGVRLVNGTEVELEMPTENGKEASISIVVVDANNDERIVGRRKLKYVSVHKPTLHVFAVGVNKYKAEGFTKLDYAEQDAKDFTNVIMEMADKNMYKKVDTTLILGSAATTFNLQERLTQLSNQVEPNDVVMIFFSGHGLKENKKSYFISSDAIRPYQGLDMEFIHNRADEMECPVFVFMDACHSGPSYDKTKGVIEPIIVAEKGVIGFYSCQSGQQSIEKKDYKNGVFTYVLVRGLKGAADVDEDGYISISDLENYVKKQVPLLSERKQTPIVINTEVGDAILFRIKKK